MLPTSACTRNLVERFFNRNNAHYARLMRSAHEVRKSLNNEEGKQILANIRTLRERFEPEVLAKEDALKSRWAKAA